jgi:hypothetical protein
VLTELLCPVAPGVEELLRVVVVVVIWLDDPPPLELPIVPTRYEVLLSVVICAAGTVIFVIATPLAVYAQRQ